MDHSVQSYTEQSAPSLLSVNGGSYFSVHIFTDSSSLEIFAGLSSAAARRDITPERCVAIFKVSFFIDVE